MAVHGLAERIGVELIVKTHIVCDPFLRHGAWISGKPKIVVIQMAMEVWYAGTQEEEKDQASEGLVELDGMDRRS